MVSIQQILTLFLMLAMELSLTSCGAEGTTQPTPEISEPPAQVQETPEPAPVPSPEPELEVTKGTETYRGFQMDNVLHAPEGDIHYHIYISDSYDGSQAYALFLTLPGYEGLYFHGMGQNLYSENFAFEALNYSDHMIVATPQLSDWGETSTEQTIALTEYLLGHYNIDQERVYAVGYSGGGETMSQVIRKHDDQQSTDCRRTCIGAGAFHLRRRPYRAVRPGGTKRRSGHGNGVYRRYPHPDSHG